MCGLVGTWGIATDPAARERALDSLARRGPDAGAWWHGEGVHLGHRRLSIIDLSEAANQPFHKHGLHLVYNGEIYNFRALRDELAALGASFHTQSDTEVVLEAFRHWGPGCFRRLRGMFALAIYDEDTGALTLARDPFGIKPLFVWRTAAGIAFSSEIKALRALGAPADVDPAAIAASMLLLWLPPGVSAFRSIERLEPGRYLVADATGLAETVYWDHRTELVDRAEPCSTQDLRAVIEQAVAAHMVADVPVSTFLSGGLDSSLITVLARRHNPAIEAYTIRMSEADRAAEAMPQDVLYARKLARAEGIRLHEIEVSPDIVEWLPQMVAALDEPISDPATINVMLICRAAGAKVLLSGMGADELFGGYRRHQAMMLARHYRRLPGVLRAALSAGAGVLPVSAGGRGIVPVRWLKRFLALASGGTLADAYLRSYSYYDRAGLAAAARGGGVVHDAIRAEHAAVFDAPVDLPTRMNLVDLHYFLPGLNLAYTDRGSMHASTEVRTPFVDIEVARAAFGIAGARKTSPWQAKIALKQAAEAWLPREIVYRPKASFGVPLRAWVRGPLAGRIRALATDSRLVAEGHVNGGEITRMVDELQAGRADWSYQLWHLLALDAWLRGLA